MNPKHSGEFLFQVVSLLISVIIIHSLYLIIIKPQANYLLEQHQQATQQDLDQAPPSSIFIVLKDTEQEACLTLMLWALMIMGYKSYKLYRERKLLDYSLLNLDNGSAILPGDTRNLERLLETLPEEDQTKLLPRALHKGLQRFRSSHQVTDASTAIKDACDNEYERLDSELAMIRYITWAIPSIGFIGTVRGIGDALGLAHKALEGDISGITASLGVAFNSTFIALIISIVVMFLTHQLQLMQEKLILDSESYCDDHLLRHLETNV